MIDPDGKPVVMSMLAKLPYIPAKNDTRHSLNSGRWVLDEGRTEWVEVDDSGVPTGRRCDSDGIVFDGRPKPSPRAAIASATIILLAITVFAVLAAAVQVAIMVTTR